MIHSNRILIALHLGLSQDSTKKAGTEQFSLISMISSISINVLPHSIPLEDYNPNITIKKKEDNPIRFVERDDIVYQVRIIVSLAKITFLRIVEFCQNDKDGHLARKRCIFDSH